MKQYLLLIHDNSRCPTLSDDWDRFFEAARQSGTFRGSSEIGTGEFIGKASTEALSSNHITRYMRFDSDDKQAVLDLLTQRPVVKHGLIIP